MASRKSCRLVVAHSKQQNIIPCLMGLGLPLTVTIRVSRVSAIVSARFSVH